MSSSKFMSKFKSKFVTTASNLISVSTSPGDMAMGHTLLCLLAALRISSVLAGKTCHQNDEPNSSFLLRTARRSVLCGRPGLHNGRKRSLLTS